MVTFDENTYTSVDGHARCELTASTAVYARDALAVGLRMVNRAFTSAKLTVQVDVVDGVPTEVQLKLFVRGQGFGPAGRCRRAAARWPDVEPLASVLDDLGDRVFDVSRSTTPLLVDVVPVLAKVLGNELPTMATELARRVDEKSF